MLKRYDRAALGHPIEERTKVWVACHIVDHGAKTEAGARPELRKVVLAFAAMMTSVEELYLDGLAETRLGKKSYDVDVSGMAEAERTGEPEAKVRYTMEVFYLYASRRGRRG